LNGSHGRLTEWGRNDIVDLEKFHLFNRTRKCVSLFGCLEPVTRRTSILEVFQGKHYFDNRVFQTDRQFINGDEFPIWKENRSNANMVHFGTGLERIDTVAQDMRTILTRLFSCETEVNERIPGQRGK
jgi:hypothetical protein